MLTLELPLRLRVTGVEDDPADLQLAAERQERLARPAAGGNRRLAVPHELLRTHPQPRQRARQPGENVRRLLAEHQSARERARPARLRRDDPAAAGLAIADRDVLARLPQIALDQLRRPIDRPLERALDQEPRPHLADIVIKDRLAAPIADLFGELTQPLRRDLRIGLQLLTDPLLERVQDRPGRRPRIRSAAPPPPTASTPCPAPTQSGELISRAESPSTRFIRLTSAHCSTPTNRLPPVRSQSDRASVTTQPDNPPATPKWPRFRAAQVA